MIKYEHLTMKPFVYGKQDCYTLLRNFYIDNFGITLPNFARPKFFWKHGLNLYMDGYSKIGFELLECHPSEYQAGDVVLCAIDSQTANHVGVLVDSGKILHHLWGRFSVAEPYAGLSRNTTLAVIRHKDVKLTGETGTAELLDLVPPRVRRKLDEYLRENELPV
jgi:cell wall-associated NlpC family hydrolase